MLGGGGWGGWGWGVLLMELGKLSSARNLDLFSSLPATRRVCSDSAGGRASASQPHTDKRRSP